MLDFEAAYEEIKARTARALNKAGALVLQDAKNMCPVRTGRLRDSLQLVEATPDSLDISIYSNVPYAPYVEAGTSRMAAQPFALPALEMNRAAIDACFENII